MLKVVTAPKPDLPHDNAQSNHLGGPHLRSVGTRLPAQPTHRAPIDAHPCEPGACSTPDAT